MKKTLRWLIPILIVANTVLAQPKNSSGFKMPTGITSNSYQAGKVWVKFKAGYKSALLSNTSGRLASIPGTLKPLKRNHGQIASARVQAFKPTIDLSLYYEITFDRTIPVETFINELYASGIIEIAEPVYTEKMQLSPNDPSLGSQYFITKIKATEAWDVTQGSENIIIAIIDSGVDIDHPDLVDQLYINQTEANGTIGVDDDNNGYIDDIKGWDFSGADTLNAFNPDFVGDNDPGIYKSGAGFGHGTQVGGCAAASTNNGIGVSGVGFKSKLLFTKHFADNQPTSDRSYSSNLYQGILYAAENGAKIINCSWGGTYRSQVYQDIITYVTLDLGCLVVAAAGNEDTSAPLYPASYDYVLSVGATDETDTRANFSNYGPTLDLVAPGVGIFTTRYNNQYGATDGTSFSSPITAGAAALVWAVHPEYTPLQVGEQLRISADASIYSVNPESFQNKLGKGRLDVYKAVTSTSPSVRASNYQLVNSQGESAQPGDEAFLTFDFTNYLQATTSALTVAISTTSTAITITQNQINPGAIGSGETVRNSQSPFNFIISSAIGEDTEVELKITFKDGTYEDTQFFTFIPNPSYRNLDDNLITTSLSSDGRIGFADTENQTGGYGFVFNDNSILYEMGILMGSSSASILNSVRNNIGGYDDDFASTQRIQKIKPGKNSDAEVFGEFSNSATASNQKVKVKYRSMAWTDEKVNKFVILQFTLTNPKTTALSNYYFGIFSDWDISYFGQEDAAQWNQEYKIGYVFPKQSENLPHAGIQSLNSSSLYYAIDNDGSISENPFGIYDGFSDTEKFTTLSTNRLEAGQSNVKGNDVSHVISTGPFTLNAGESVTIAFALHASMNLDDLLTSAKRADSVYQLIENVILDSEKSLESAISIYPSPADKTLSIDASALNLGYHQSALVTLYSMQGVALHETKISATTVIDTATYPAGLYLVKIHTANESMVKKVIISH